MDAPENKYKKNNQLCAMTENYIYPSAWKVFKKQTILQ